VAWLQRHGRRAALAGARPQTPPPPDEALVGRFAAADPGVLELVRNHDRGLIRFADGKVMPSRLIAQAARAWPRLTFAVAATRCEDVRRVRRELAGHGVEATMHTHRASPRAGRVAVGTHAHLGEVDLERRDVFFALDPADLFNGKGHHTYGIDVIKNLDRARAYGFLPAGVRVPPYPRDLITALFGVEEVYLPAHGERPVGVFVAFANVWGGGPPPTSSSENEVKKAGIHKHHMRNRRVARMAAALHAKDLALTGELCPDFAGHVRVQKFGVGVLVDDVGHGLDLSGRLGWPLLTAEGVNVTGLSAEEKARIKRGREGAQPVVVTVAAMAEAGRFDALVRADGGVGLPDLPEKLLRVEHGSERGLLIIDLDDRHHPLLRQRSRRRREAYVEAGWRVAGVEVSHLDSFLAARPEVARG
jgi:hypothetical protein